MRVQVLADDGTVLFQASTIQEAADYVAASEHKVIGSIKADIQAAIVRIETELGAHPAFTWAQTKLGNAVAHLEAYVAGRWTEPDPAVAAQVVHDDRGMIVRVDKND
jgi:hypothetical protein